VGSEPPFRVAFSGLEKRTSPWQLTKKARARDDKTTLKIHRAIVICIKMIIAEIDCGIV
jgi:hypothetical protein